MKKTSTLVGVIFGVLLIGMERNYYSFKTKSLKGQKSRHKRFQLSGGKKKTRDFNFFLKKKKSNH
jgi:hypothetical protein